MQHRSPAPQEDCLSPILFTLLLFWTVGVVYVSILGQVFFSSAPRFLTPLTTILLGIGQAFLVGLPALALGSFWSNRRYRAIFQTWALANAYTLVMLPARLLDPNDAKAQAVLQIVLSLAFSLILLGLARYRAERTGGERTRRPVALTLRPLPVSGLLAAVAAAALVALPWLAFGALGSPLDVLLDGLVGLSIGLVFGLLIEFFFLRPLLDESAGLPALPRWQTFFLGGLGAGLPLLVIANSLANPFGGRQLLLALFLPALSWAVMALALLQKEISASSGRTQPVRTGAVAAKAQSEPNDRVELDELDWLETPETGAAPSDSSLGAAQGAARGAQVFDLGDTQQSRVRVRTTAGEDPALSDTQRRPVAAPARPSPEPAEPPLNARWLPFTVLVGLAASLPLAFFDPDEMALIFSGSAGEAIQWAVIAAAVAMALGLALGLLLFLLVQFVRTPEGPVQGPPWLRPVLGALALSLLVAGAALYFDVGQPGFYGERMFVVLESQADLSEAAQLPAGADRRQFVYTTLVEHANTTQAGLRQTLDRFRIPYQPYYLVNALDVPDNPLLRLYLSTRPEVDRILHNPRMRPLFASPPTGRGSATAPTEPQWNLTMIGADRVWNELGVTGEGIVVGQSDSGVQVDHPELADSYRGQGGQHDYNWLDPWNGTPAPVDIGGHGTHTLGSVLGNSTGVAPGATWFACANLARNQGNPSYYLDCMQFMLAPFPRNGDPMMDGDPSRGADVINNSWGCPELEGCDPTSLLPAVRALRAAGIFVEVSAGNDGPLCYSLDSPPAIYDEVYTTGAINDLGQVATFSSIGPVNRDGSGRIKPDIIAPGEDVLSAMPGSTYGRLSGTSMAGPHVVGVVALMWSANPDLIGDIDRTEAILNATARPYTGEAPQCPGADGLPSTVSGYGVLDAYAAVQMALETP